MDKSWLITGVNRGIGKGIALAALARGHTLVGTVRQDADVPGTRDALGGPSDRLQLLTCDVRDGIRLNAVASTMGGAVDVLVHNAGVFGPRAPRQIDVSAEDIGPDYLNAFDVNVLGVLRVTLAFKQHLERSARPRLVLISSLMGSLQKEGDGHMAYRASKAAANKSLQVLAHELAPARVRCVALRPGSVSTDMNPGGPVSVEKAGTDLVTLIENLPVGPGCDFLDTDGSALQF